MKAGDVIIPRIIDDPPLIHPRQFALPDPPIEWMEAAKRYGEILNTGEPARRALKPEEYRIKKWLERAFAQRFRLRPVRGKADIHVERRFGRSGHVGAYGEKPGCLPYVDHVVTWNGEGKRVLTSQPYGSYKSENAWDEELLKRCEEHAQLYDLNWAISQKWSYHFPTLTFLLFWEAADGTRKPTIRVLEAARGEDLRYSSDW